MEELLTTSSVQLGPTISRMLGVKLPSPTQPCGLAAQSHMFACEMNPPNLRVKYGLFKKTLFFCYICSWLKPPDQPLSQHGAPPRVLKRSRGFHAGGALCLFVENVDE